MKKIMFVLALASLGSALFATPAQAVHGKSSSGQHHHSGHQPQHHKHHQHKA